MVGSQHETNPMSMPGFGPTAMCQYVSLQTWYHCTKTRMAIALMFVNNIAILFSNVGYEKEVGFVEDQTN